jgi:hypothetical protein
MQKKPKDNKESLREPAKTKLLTNFMIICLWLASREITTINNQCSTFSARQWVIHSFGKVHITPGFCGNIRQSAAL